MSGSLLRNFIPLLDTLPRIPLASRRMLLSSILAGLAAGGCSTALLAFINHILASAERPSAASIAAFCGLCLFMLATGILSELLILRLMQDNLFALRLWLTRRILSAPLQQLQACGAPRLMAALTDDITNVAHAHEALPVLFIEGSIALGGFVYVGYLSRVLFTILLVFLIAGLIMFFAAQRWSLHWLRLAREADDALFGHFRALTEGCKELKINARRRRAFLDDELRATAGIIRKRFNKGLSIFILGAHSSKLLFFAAIGTVLFAPSPNQGISAEVVTGWTLAILFIMAPVSTIVNTVPIVGQGVVALRKLEALGFSMSQEVLIEDESECPPLREQAGILELAGVIHSYRTSHDGPVFRLGPLDLRINPGELVFITGGNGDGKTTLALLLMGLLAPEMGSVLLDGQPVTDDQRDAFRQNFSAVFADAFIFESLLGYGDGLSLARAESLLSELELSHKLAIDGGRFSTVDLSRGQRKRLALLTAYIEDRPFFIFDEWAAEQDPVFREIFYTKLLAGLKARGKTVIVVTHDDRYYHLADRLLRLNAGQIEEMPAGRARAFEQRLD